MSDNEKRWGQPKNRGGGRARELRIFFFLVCQEKKKRTPARATRPGGLAAPARQVHGIILHPMGVRGDAATGVGARRERARARPSIYTRLARGAFSLSFLPCALAKRHAGRPARPPPPSATTPKTAITNQARRWWGQMRGGGESHTPRRRGCADS